MMKELIETGYLQRLQRFIVPSGINISNMIDNRIHSIAQRCADNKEGFDLSKEWLLINEDGNFIIPINTSCFWGLESSINILYLDVLLISIIIIT